MYTQCRAALNRPEPADLPPPPPPAGTIADVASEAARRRQEADLSRAIDQAVAPMRRAILDKDDAITRMHQQLAAFLN